MHLLVFWYRWYTHRLLYLRNELRNGTYENPLRHICIPLDTLMAAHTVTLRWYFIFFVVVVLFILYFGILCSVSDSKTAKSVNQIKCFILSEWKCSPGEITNVQQQRRDVFRLCSTHFWYTLNCDEGFVISFYVMLSKIANLINCMGPASFV